MTYKPDSYLLHGADYNPEQWIDTPEIWDEDMRLMKLAGFNRATIGIFSWAKLEPREGEYDFAWLDTVMDKLHANGLKAILATPSAGKPQWLMAKYPEVMLVEANRQRLKPGQRVNHCNTSPVFREKAAQMSRQLAQRYKNHPALSMWHVSNEIAFECHCDLCQAAFRQWLKDKYGTLDELNRRYWSTFWSHTFTEWEQIESPSPQGENLIHGLNLDWRRFMTVQTVDFIRQEAAPLREITPHVPVTTNLMPGDLRFDPNRMAEVLDVVALDIYPAWRSDASDADLASETSFMYDLYRSLKDQSFILMETTPSVTNWMPVNKQKRPGLHEAGALQAIAHGSDSAFYFQWRKSRGGYEKFHGAVVDHAGHENTRVFREVARLGQRLGELKHVAGTHVPAETAIIYDWENAWAIQDAGGPRADKQYLETCFDHYRALWSQGISTDVIAMDHAFEKYKLIIAPMLYMVKPGVAERLTEFVRAGGTLVVTYWSGIVDENDLCFLGGFPGPLRSLLGIWSEEIDCLYDGEGNVMVMKDGRLPALGQSYKTHFISDVIHAESAETLAVFWEDYYAGFPALTVNRVGKGDAYYLAARAEQQFLDEWYQMLNEELSLGGVAGLPAGVTIQKRNGKEGELWFLFNFTPDKVTVNLSKTKGLDKAYSDAFELKGYEVRVMRKRMGK